MKTSRLALAALLLGSLAGFLPGSKCLAQASAPAGFGSYVPAPSQCIDDAGRQRILDAGPHGSALPLGSTNAGQVDFPSYTWPLEHVLRDGFILVNYVDDDPTTSITDYSNGSWSYDGHTGTDITLYNFRLMDRGYRILAAAPGTVTSVVYDKPDRHTGPPYADTENNVIVNNNDGSSTWYLHLRTNAVTVNPGETVVPGTMLGLVGSSGNSTDAHLHFETGQYTPAWVLRDPWHGPNNAPASLWASQLPYAGAQHMWVADMGITTQAAAGGNLNNVPITQFKERMSAPAVMGANEPWIPVFVQLQGLAGDSYHLEILRPSSTVYASVDYALPASIQYGWNLWYWGWNGGVSPADYGTWVARVTVNSVEVARTSFVVGAATVFGPRLVPKAGHSFRINGTVQRDTMHVSPLGGPVTYSLVHNPGWITLADSIVTVPAVSSQAVRVFDFQVVARDGAARRDTMWYQVVDPTKPLGEQTAVKDFPSRLQTAWLDPAVPNPVRGSTALRFACPAGVRSSLSIFDLSGRRVRQLLDGSTADGGEARTVTWDGRGDRGQRLPAGVYLARLQAGSELRTRKIALLN